MNIQKFFAFAVAAIGLYISVMSDDILIKTLALLALVVVLGMRYTSIQKIDYDDFGKYKGGQR